jgi:hypothetical protein
MTAETEQDLMAKTAQDLWEQFHSKFEANIRGLANRYFMTDDPMPYLQKVLVSHAGEYADFAEALAHSMIRQYISEQATWQIRADLQDPSLAGPQPALSRLGGAFLSVAEGPETPHLRPRSHGARSGAETA